ncbi:MAG: anti-sigma factor domain-containing protein [Bacillus sp. (in: Bacteria)]|nr:anti-sigma factor domain-containing protein [Bacillus sp. (in: firmicutes)]
MNKGVVLEKHNHFMIVMTNDGEFLRAKIDHTVDVGEETIFKPMESGRWTTFYQDKRYLSLVAAAVLFIFFMPMYQFFSPDKVYGTVTVDINPSLEFQLNSNYEVIDATGYNQEGTEIIIQLEEKIIGQPLFVVISHLINKGNELGLLTNERDIYISSSVNLSEDLWGESYGIWLESIQQKYKVNFITLAVENDVIEAAKELSISPTKYMLLQEAKDKGIDIDVEHVQNSSIETIEVDTGRKINTIVPPESIRINAPFERGRPDNPGNSQNNRNDNSNKERPGNNNDNNDFNPGRGSENNPGKETKTTLVKETKVKARKLPRMISTLLIEGVIMQRKIKIMIILLP